MDVQCWEIATWAASKQRPKMPFLILEMDPRDINRSMAEQGWILEMHMEL